MILMGHFWRYWEQYWELASINNVLSKLLKLYTIPPSHKTVLVNQYEKYLLKGDIFKNDKQEKRLL